MTEKISIYLLDEKWVEFFTVNDMPVKENQWGYGRICIYNTNCLLHRLITGANTNQIVDHINGNPYDNREENLRIASYRVNAVNSAINKNNTSGVTGVWFDKSKGVWRAELRSRGKRYQLGRFLNKEHAIRARLTGEAKYFFGIVRAEGNKNNKLIKNSSKGKREVGRS